MGETAWNDSERSTLTAVAFLRAKLEGWKIGAELIETSVANAREVITYILKDQARCPEGVLRVVYNGLELRTDITSLSSHKA